MSWFYKVLNRLLIKRLIFTKRISAKRFFGIGQDSGRRQKIIYHFVDDFLPFYFCCTNFVSFLHLCSKVNGRNILSVDYDRPLRIEKIYDDHRKFLLKIGYDTAGQPSLWMPSSKLLPVNLTRNSNGQLSAIHWGSVSERVEYDGQGRLLSRTFPDGKTWSYTYLEKVKITVNRFIDVCDILYINFAMSGAFAICHILTVFRKRKNILTS